MTLSYTQRLLLYRLYSLFFVLVKLSTTFQGETTVSDQPNPAAMELAEKIVTLPKHSREECEYCFRIRYDEVDRVAGLIDAWKKEQDDGK